MPGLGRGRRPRPLSGSEPIRQMFATQDAHHDLVHLGPSLPTSPGQTHDIGEMFARFSHFSRGPLPGEDRRED